MLKKNEILYNPFFLIPFLLWVIVGGVLLIVFKRQDIFFVINTNYSDPADKLMYYASFLGEGEIIVPILFLLLLHPKFRNWWYFFTALFCNLIPFFIQQGLKTLFDHPRPKLLYYDKTWMHSLPEWPVLLHRGFPSGHSQGAFSFFCFLSLLLTRRYDKLGILFFLLGLLVCYSRIYLTAHFFEDVYTGSVIGVGLTIIIYSIMNKYKGHFFKKGTFI